VAERFTNRDMRGAVFENCDLSGAVFKECLLFGSRITGPYGGITINGIDVGRLIWLELLRRYPERRRLLASNADGLRDALAYIDELRARTLERCASLQEEDLHRAPADGDWSIADNLRHIIHSEDAWARGRAFGDTSVSPLGRQPSFIADDAARSAGLRIDHHYSFAEVAADLDARHQWVRGRFENLADEACQQPSPAGDYDGNVFGALREYLTHEWDHHWQIEQILDGAAAPPAA
jgi:uncharacterized damage-inducible protein DinB